MPAFGNTVKGNVLQRNAIPTKNIQLAKANVTPMKSIFTNNTNYYKRGSHSTGVGTVRNIRSRLKKT